MTRTVPGVLASDEPEGRAPVVLDSPHSGRVYPADFGHALSVELLRRVEDAFVDELFADAPAHGAAFLAALFPRSYIDPNRDEADIEPAILAEPWPHEMRPSDRSRRGLGLIRSLIRPDLRVYNRALGAGEVALRIARYHRPYHAALKELLDGTVARFGAVWHLNCHSMKAVGRARPTARDDVVLGDGEGTTCDGDFTRFVADAFKAMGYSVRVNDPFKGALLVHRYSAPKAGRHSLQIELNRRLYLDEATVEKTAGFAALKADMGRLVAAVAAYARERTIAAGTARPGCALPGCDPDRTAE